MWAMLSYISEDNTVALMVGAEFPARILINIAMDLSSLLRYNVTAVYILVQTGWQ